MIDRKSELGYWEKIYLKNCGKRDAKRELIEKVEVSFSGSEANGENNGSEENKQWISSFMVSEIYRTKSEINKILSYKWKKVRLSETRLINFKMDKSSFSSYNDALSYIDKIDDDISAELRLVKLEIQKEVHELTRLYDINSEGEAEHLKVLYERKIENVYSKHNGDIITKIKVSQWLVNEKIRILKELETVTRHIVTRHQLRMSYYYENARLASKKRKNVIDIPITTSFHDITKELSDDIVLESTKKLIKEAELRMNDLEKEIKKREVEVMA